MSAPRYPDNNRYPPRDARDRSPPYRDRRPSQFGSSYVPRGNDSLRPSGDSASFASRDAPRGPKSNGDPPRGPASGPPSSAPSAPRDGRGRGFLGRTESSSSLRDAPPLSSGPPAFTNSWRADRDRDRDFVDRRERRPTPPRRSPIRDSRDPRDSRDQRDFGPRDLDVGRARRNSRDGPPSAGSTYSDPPALGAGSSYRGSGISRGRGGFPARGRTFHDDRDRHHDPRDRPPMDRSYRPRSRSPPVRRERDIRDDRDFDRRDRDDRRFVPREYDSYIGPAGAKPGPRAIDTHRGPGPSDSRHAPGTPTGLTPHSSHHASPSDRISSQADNFSRRSSVAVDSSAPKDVRREPSKDEALLASRAEASKERYQPRPSSPPASIPAFGGSSVWRAPVADVKTTSAAPSQPKPAPPAPTPAATPATSTTAIATSNAPIVAPVAPPASSASTVPVSSSATPSTVPIVSPPVPTAPKASIPQGLSTQPPTGPKADRQPERSLDASQPGPIPASRPEPASFQPPTAPKSSVDAAGSGSSVPKAPAAQQTTPLPPSFATTIPQPAPVPAFQAKSPPLGPAAKSRAPSAAPQTALRANVSPSFARAQLPQFAPRDASPGAPPSGPRSATGATAPAMTSPQSLPANIPTGPKADRTPMAQRSQPMYPGNDRVGFAAPRPPIGGGPKSMQWVRPGLIQNRPSIPTKREFTNEDRGRDFGSAPKAPRLDLNNANAQAQRMPQAKSVSPSFTRATADQSERPRERAASAERRSAVSPKPASIETRRYSDVVMAEASPRNVKPPMSAASSAPEALQDSDDDVDLDEDDFAESEAKYNREVARLEAKKIDLSAPHLRAISPLQELTLLSCLGIEHLPQAKPEQKLVEEITSPSAQETPISPPVQPPSETGAVKLPTPQEDDIEMEDAGAEPKAERSMAPATMALRLRHGQSPGQESEIGADTGSLPYLGSGPPTPLSDIGQAPLPESLMEAMRSKLQETTEAPEGVQDALAQYAQAYKQWRINIRPMDDALEQERDPERLPSAEPNLKAVTPDVQTNAMTGILDGSVAPTSRRTHASRWATELDLEAVIKESLKTAEEERIGKKDREPRQAMADPEKEADLPLEFTEPEAQRRRFIDTNFQREPGQGIFVFHYEPPEDDFTEEEHKVMVYNYKDQYAKKWGKLAEVLHKELGTERTYKDCINHYYSTKWDREYKGKIKRGRGGARKRGVGRNRGAIANMDRPENAGEDGTPLPVTETGRPRRSAAPTFGGPDTETDPATASSTPGRARRQTDADSTQEKVGRPRKAGKEKVGRKPKNQPLAAAPVGSTLKQDRKDKNLGVKNEDEVNKRTFNEMPMPMQAGMMEEQILLPGDPQNHPSLPVSLIDRPKAPTTSRPGPSSYWSVSELSDFEKNVAHFGTDWISIANHMGTKTHTMIKNQYIRTIEGGARKELERKAQEADLRRERGEDLGPPPTPTPAPKRRYESTQAAPVRQIAPTPEQKSPLINPLALPKSTPPHAAPPRFSTIAPTQGKPLVAAPGYPSMPESNPSNVQQHQSPPLQPQRVAPQQLHQPNLAQHKPQHAGPRAGYFTPDDRPRLDSRPPSQAGSLLQSSRPAPQPIPPSQMRPQEPQHHSPGYRSLPYQDRESMGRSEMQQQHEQEAQRFQHARRISQEVQHRAFAPGAPAPTFAPPMRAPSGARSPEHRPLPFGHNRHISQSQPVSQPPADVYSRGPGAMPGSQQLPPRSTIPTPPVKEEPRNLPPSAIPPPHPQLHQQQQMPPQLGQPMPATATPAPPKPAEPRKSNLMSLLNDDGPEEPPRKKAGPPSHSSTPQPSAPIAPPPPAPQGYAPSSRQPGYEDPAVSQSAYGRPSYAQQPGMSSTANRSIDLTNDRSGLRDNWQQRPQYQSQGPPPSSVPPSQSGPPQPSFNDSRMYNHRSVAFGQSAQHQPSPPPMAGYNSPHLHSRTPSISAARPGGPNTTAAQHAQASASGAQILQPNPYAQVEPPGTSAPPSGPMGMRPSPHIHSSHLAQQRDALNRNELSQSQNGTLSYSTPQTPVDQPGSHPGHRSSASITESYRPRDPRDMRFDARASDRDTSRELSQRADYLQERLRSVPPQHEETRYQPPQDRGYMSQRSQTPLSRMESVQPAPLQHPPHSSLGSGNGPLFSQRPPEDRYSQTFPRDRNLERMREEQEWREEQQRQSYMGGRGPPPTGPAGQDQRGPVPPPPQGPGPMDWTSGVRHPDDRWRR